MANETLKIIKKLREDISEYLFHFTKGEDAFETLQKILDEGKLRGFNDDRYICFTESPITMLCGFFKYVERTYSTPTIIAPYGIGIKKDILFYRTPIILNECLDRFDPPVNWKKSQPVRNTYKFKLKVKEGLSVFRNTMTWTSSSLLDKTIPCGDGFKNGAVS